MDGDLDPADGDLIGAGCPGLRPADLVFLFGTRLPQPAHLAAEAFTKGLAPCVVVTGGSGRQEDGRNEARHHQSILLERGVPASAIVAEDQSTHTAENVELARPLVLDAIGPPRSVIVVVKRFHRRALVELARGLPSIERIYALTYDPDPPPSKERLEREVQYLRSLQADRVDLLRRTDDGWIRTSPAHRT